MPTKVPPRPDILVPVPEPARRLSCSERQIWRLLRGGRRKSIRIGSMTRTTEKSIQDPIDGD